MKFTSLSLNGLYLIEPERIPDERGYFARVLCKQEFLENGLHFCPDQCSVSFNHKKGTLRGMHLQKFPHEEIKLVTCTRGEIFDVVIDMRPESPTYKNWEAVNLSAENKKMLYIPKGFAHGFQTLVDNTEVYYQISGLFSPQHAIGIRWNDPAFKIAWPADISVISKKDQQYADHL